jgi:hypothetical protein
MPIVGRKFSVNERSNSGSSRSNRGNVSNDDIQRINDLRGEKVIQ